ncbi:MAG: hypothetical protein R3C05_09445 [Pirellulaceae bacterium]
MELIIDARGNCRCVYDECIDIHRLGKPTIRRGSHVEPTTDGTWTADLSPISGPLLGPFSARSEAIDAEISWLRKHWLKSDD